MSANKSFAFLQVERRKTQIMKKRIQQLRIDNASNENRSQIDLIAVQGDASKDMAKRLRIDCANIAQRLRIDHAAISQRLRSVCATIVKRILTDCATTAKRLQSDYATVDQHSLVNRCSSMRNRCAIDV
jgi:hypothetical protein